MDRTQLVSELYATRLVAVVRSPSAREAVALAHAAMRGGIRFVEITFSVPGALDVIRDLSREGKIHVGAGTVLASQQAERAIQSGAQFIVSPSLELNLIGICHAANIACFPGAATPTEIIAAHRAHADLVKIFPADLLGGPDFIKQMQGPFPEPRYMVSGGVNLENVQDYVRAGVTGICLGSAYLGALLSARGEKDFIAEMQQFTKRVEQAQEARLADARKKKA
jgi:2-dehydro-3-deoxyphosphogluconate aldolase/(4S)-4-hydroxy-2-oxoglutarate aldolase